VNAVSNQTVGRLQPLNQMHGCAFDCLQGCQVLLCADCCVSHWSDDTIRGNIRREPTARACVAPHGLHADDLSRPEGLGAELRVPVFLQDEAVRDAREGDGLIVGKGRDEVDAQEAVHIVQLQLASPVHLVLKDHDLGLGHRSGASWPRQHKGCRCPKRKPGLCQRIGKGQAGPCTGNAARLAAAVRREQFEASELELALSVQW